MFVTWPMDHELMSSLKDSSAWNMLAMSDTDETSQSEMGVVMVLGFRNAVNRSRAPLITDAGTVVLAIGVATEAEAEAEAVPGKVGVVIGAVGAFVVPLLAFAWTMMMPFMVPLCGGQLYSNTPAVVAVQLTEKGAPYPVGPASIFSALS